MTRYARAQTLMPRRLTPYLERQVPATEPSAAYRQVMAWRAVRDAIVPVRATPAGDLIGRPGYGGSSVGVRTRGRRLH